MRTENDHGGSDEVNEYRRRLLQGAGASGVIGLAGCLGGIVGDDGDENGGENGGDGTGDENGDDSSGGNGDDPAVFGVSGLTPEAPTIAEGGSLTVSATITNDGDEEGTQEIELHVEEEVHATETLTLAGGDAETVSFAEVDVADLEAGEYAFGVSSEDGDVAGTLTVVEGVDPLFGEFTYEYYEGEWDAIPDFDGLDPDDEGPVPDDLISLSPRQQGSDYAFVFEGQLSVGERLLPGEYTFHVESDAGSRLLVDDEAVVDSPDAPADETGTVELSEGAYQFRLEYVDTAGVNQLAVGWEGPYGELLPQICVDDPLREGDEWAFERQVGDLPEIQRIYMPNTGSKSFGVGLPTYTNCCFNPETGAVDYAWRGAFVDWGPMVSYGTDRGDYGTGNVLGVEFPIGGTEYPLRVGDADSEPEFDFGGYRMAPHPPEIMYSVDGHEVTQTVESPASELGLRFTFEFEDAPDEPVYFRTDADADIEREASTGEWSNGVLEVPAGESEFTVTLTTEVVN